MATVVIAFINTFIPFADPSRPVWRDIILTVVIITALYAAPQLQREGFQSFTNRLQNIKIRPGDNNEHLREQNIQPDAQADEPQLPEPPQRQENVPHAQVEDAPDSEDEEDEEDEWEHVPPQLLQQQMNGVPVAGPADAPPFRNDQPQQLQPPRQRDPNRQVGAKKAKSLARRNQVRAYHEFMREQGDIQRARDASTAAEREKELAAERVRREKVEAEIVDQKQRERVAKREREAKERTEEANAVREALKIIAETLTQQGMLELADIAQHVNREAQWGESLVRREGLLGLRHEGGKKVFTLLTGQGWLVRVDEDSMKELYHSIATTSFKNPDGTQQYAIGWEELGDKLGNVIRSQNQPALVDI